MSELELCFECYQPTGRAGAAEDSLYLGSIGPFCEDCYEEWPDNMDILMRHVKSELAAAKAEVERLRAAVEKLRTAGNRVISYGEPVKEWAVAVQDALYPEQAQRLHSLRLQPGCGGDDELLQEKTKNYQRVSKVIDDEFGYLVGEKVIKDWLKNIGVE